MEAAPLITDVADTARWVAAHRAAESARPDALFHDPLAARLAGEHGRRIAAVMGGASGHGWPMNVRTRLIDDEVATALAAGCTGVLNLAAGLDTRPYRLPLPADLRWLEVDQAGLLAEKARLLADERPRCQLECRAADLADAAARAELFAEVEGWGRRVLVISEGLVMYLDAGAVAGLARDLRAQPSFVRWTLDFSSPAILRQIQRESRGRLANAPLRFGPPDGVGFFERLGWRARAITSLFHAGVRWRRVPWWQRPFAWLPPPDPRAPGERKPWSAIVCFEQGGPHAP
ncbi:MAG: class I SAM-dependent methyltransferase [Myxococcales bacterium]|nr:class I SAM-dependent methyltransferase [Myxococcales bacterium]